MNQINVMIRNVDFSGSQAIFHSKPKIKEKQLQNKNKENSEY